jgi:UDP-N-acetylmuramoylalanine--D-glutamate ligase
LELGFQQVHCLCIAVSGTNGKGTTAELLARILEANHRTTLIAGHEERPICSVIQESKGLDYLILNVDPRQLEATELFRPVVAVLLNAGAGGADHSEGPDDVLKYYARLFRQQQLFDWAIIQSETLARLRQLNLAPNSKIITFSARDENSELHVDRGLVLSSLPRWPGPLLDLDRCRFSGRHNSENIMAALAVGHVLKVPLETMKGAVTSFTPLPHRFQLVAEVNGVKFVNDAKASNLEALQTALLAVQGKGGGPNVWLIAGGADKGASFHDLGPLVSKRVRRAFLLGEAAERIRSAWSLFTPCTIGKTLLEAVHEAAKNAAFGDVVLFSPACLSFGHSQNYQQSGESFCQAVESISRGQNDLHPNINDKLAAREQ